jgi:hypothetical protein
MSTPVKLTISPEIGFRWITAKTKRLFLRRGWIQFVRSTPVVEFAVIEEHVERFTFSSRWTPRCEGHVMNGAALQIVPRKEA